MTRREPETIAEIRAEIGRLQGKLARLVLGDPSERVQARAPGVPLLASGPAPIPGSNTFNWKLSPEAVRDIEANARRSMHEAGSFVVGSPDVDR